MNEDTGTTEVTETTEVESAPEPIGNELFQQVVLKPYAEALQMMKATPKPCPSEAEMKRKKNKRDVQKTSRKNNR